MGGEGYRSSGVTLAVPAPAAPKPLTSGSRHRLHTILLLLPLQSLNHLPNLAARLKQAAVTIRHRRSSIVEAHYQFSPLEKQDAYVVYSRPRFLCYESRAAVGGPKDMAAVVA